MYISKPLNIGVIKALYRPIPNLYPFLGVLVQIFLPFWATEGIYRLIHRQKQIQKEVCN